MANEARVGGLKGTYFLEAATAHTGKRFSMIVINSDAVFTHLNTVGGVNALASQNLVARTVKQGSIICAAQNPDGSMETVDYFNSVTLASGDAIGVISE